MPEQLLLTHEAEQNLPSASIVGEVPIGEIVDQPINKVRVGDFLVSTNLPEDAVGFANDEKTKEYIFGVLQDPVFGIIPRELDGLAAGSYWTEVNIPTDEYKSDVHSVPNHKTTKQTFLVKETPDGKVFETEDLLNQGWFVIRFADGTILLESLGFEITHPTKGRAYIEAFPTPETVKGKAKEFGVDIEFVPGMDKIKGKKYLSIFADGKYPVSTKTQDSYLHDVHDDHLTTMILGGDMLRNTLKTIASNALNEPSHDPNNPTQEIDNAAVFIDNFTANLREVISVRLGVNKYEPEYYTKQAINRFEAAASLVGIRISQAYEILDSAVTRAKELGMAEKTEQNDSGEVDS